MCFTSLIAENNKEEDDMPHTESCLFDDTYCLSVRKLEFLPCHINTRSHGPYIGHEGSKRTCLAFTLKTSQISLLPPGKLALGMWNEANSSPG